LLQEITSVFMTGLIGRIERNLREAAWTMARDNYMLYIQRVGNYPITGYNIICANYSGGPTSPRQQL